MTKQAVPKDDTDFNFTYGKPATATIPSVFDTLWGREGTGDGQFIGPVDVAVDSSGNVYVAEWENDRIQKFDNSGTFLTKWGVVGDGDGQFVGPRGVAVDGNGNVYVADSGNHRIQKFNSSGAFLAKWGSEGRGDDQFNDPSSVVVDGSGNVYVLDRGNSRIQKFDSSGAFLTKWGSGGNGDGQFNRPGGLTVDGIGNVYVADHENERIQKFDSNGVFLTKWGSYGTGDGQFVGPTDVAVDGIGNVYVAGGSNHRIQKFDSSGNFLTRWGSEGRGSGQFGYPIGVEVDGSGNVYVADIENHRIQKFAPASPVSTPVTGITAGQSRVFSDLVLGTYTLPETVPVGWVLQDVTCDNDVSTTLLDDGIAIDLNGEDTTCTFTNVNVETPKLTVIKEVINDNGGTSVASDFTINISATNPSQTSFVGSSSGITITLEAGNYNVTESVAEGYAISYSDDCSGTIALGESKSCTVTNDDIAPQIDPDELTQRKIFLPVIHRSNSE
ncbi:hypothetical protein KFU94_64910 [Chloroflexi bacterium TSY]|nr:hypothetical protein [Chloroflexi bacterium TSY]